MVLAAYGAARARLPEPARTLVTCAGMVWIWPGIPLTSRRGAEIVPASAETIRFWITRLHGPKSIWDGPENKVRVPTLKHWVITGWYMTPNEDYDGLSPRAYLRGRSWDEKVRVGREALIDFGVLKP